MLHLGFGPDATISLPLVETNDFMNLSVTQPYLGIGVGDTVFENRFLGPNPNPLSQNLCSKILSSLVIMMEPVYQLTLGAGLEDLL